VEESPVPSPEEEAIAARAESAAKRFWPYTVDVFRERFVSPFQRYASRIGQRFTVLGHDTEAENDLEQFEPMYRIRFEDGTEITAWGEEVCVADEEPGKWVGRQAQQKGDGPNR
jgi:hypothetical protein